MQRISKRKRVRKRHRKAAALLICIFVVAMCSLTVTAMLDSRTFQMTVLRHTYDYERAEYLAGAAVHHALAELEVNPSWRTGIVSQDFSPSGGGTYSATVIDDAGNTVIVTGEGIVDGITRRLQVTVQL
jgi:hypothetical protein